MSIPARPTEEAASFSLMTPWEPVGGVLSRTWGRLNSTMIPFAETWLAWAYPLPELIHGWSRFEICNNQDAKDDCVCVEGVPPKPQAPGVQQCIDLMNQRLSVAQEQLGVFPNLDAVSLVRVYGHDGV